MGIDIGAYEWYVPVTATISAVTPNPRLEPVDQMTITFSVPVTGMTLANLQLTRNGGGANLLTSNQSLAALDNQTFVLQNLSGLTAASGDYTLTLVQSSAIHDALGMPLVSPPSAAAKGAIEADVLQRLDNNPTL